MAFVWMNENVLKLITLYQDSLVLRDCWLTKYKNRNKRHDALVELANYFQIEKAEIQFLFSVSSCFTPFLSDIGLCERVICCMWI